MMTRNNLVLTLSLEEVAVVLSLLGYPEVAKGLLVTQLGEISADEERGRLLAANHSLLAKNILYLQGDKIRMEPPYAQLLGFLTTNDYALRGTIRQIGQPEQILNFYARGERLVEHRITHGVVHTFREVSDVEKALDACISFLGMESDAPFAAASFTLTNAQIEEARSLAAEQAEIAFNYLHELGAPKESARLFAEDLGQQKMRAAVLRVNVNMATGLTSDYGYLTLGGASGRYWLMDINALNGTSMLVVQPMTKALTRKLTRALMNGEQYVH